MCIHVSPQHSTDYGMHQHSFSDQAFMRRPEKIADLYSEVRSNEYGFKSRRFRSGLTLD